MSLDQTFRIGSANIDLVEKMYTQYLLDPYSIDQSWRAFFDDFESEDQVKSSYVKEKDVYPVIDRSAPADLRIYNLIVAYRTYGHLMAKINPITTQSVKEPWQLHLETLGFDESDLSNEFPTNGLLSKPSAPLEQIIHTLRVIYCGTIGVEYMGVQNPQLEQWLQKQIEPSHFHIKLSINKKKMILQNLNKSELFEVFLHTKYTGQKRFSLEGGETLIPILAATINKGADLGMTEFVLGMAHRGRLNVLSNIMNKSYSDIFSEFEERYIPLSFEGSGDVKYHKGFSSDVETFDGKKVKVNLTPNPSHLEAVNPVVEGQVRAKQVKRDDIHQEGVVPILIHGDAAFSGQGVVYETMQLYHLNGYSTGGTIHVIINNQIGFTTLPEDGRSTTYCTDIAKTFQAPVFHVNAEDPEGCIHAAHLAVELRQKFHCDVVIDLNCYRKYGHNEADEPAFTQPHEYSIIRKKKPIRQMYRDDLIQQGVLEKQMAEALEEEFKASLQKDLQEIKNPKQKSIKKPQKSKKKPSNLFKKINTGVEKKRLVSLAGKFCHIPDGLSVHRKLKRLIDDRLLMAKGEKSIDWGMGEMLAYASLLSERTPVRIAGQDVCRGTFSHRHAMWVDQEVEKAYYPLKHLGKDQARFDIINSPLSEYACLGFEYGYSLAYPETLVIWEAQFGDFANGAQVMIDQFISSAEQKWGQKNSVTLLLPHGYEGQGPEHSSARLERFLQLCGDDNLVVTNPTSPAQLFHLLRRQALKPMEKPLIVMTPKGLLRHPKCVNHIDDFTKGHFQEIFDDNTPAQKVKRLVFCSGRIYYDLIKEREENKAKDIAIVRIEQLYPFDKDQLKKIITKYKRFKDCYWVQEEPANMGAWNFIRPYLSEQISKNQNLIYIGREASASPAVGSLALHNKKHKEIMGSLFGN